jgi:hypothetical protein
MAQGFDMLNTIPIAGFVLGMPFYVFPVVTPDEAEGKIQVLPSALSDTAVIDTAQMVTPECFENQSEGIILLRQITEIAGQLDCACALVYWDDGTRAALFFEEDMQTAKTSEIILFTGYRIARESRETLLVAVAKGNIQ